MTLRSPVVVGCMSAKVLPAGLGDDAPTEAAGPFGAGVGHHGEVRVAGLLLTGGASRRLGRDKATLPLPGGTTLARRTAALLSAVADPALELGPGVSGLDHVPDPTAPTGPLAAVAGGVVALRRRGWEGPALVVATDLPRLSAGLLQWLAAYPVPRSVVPCVDGRPQWLCARYSPAALAAAGSLVAGGERAVRLLAEVAPVELAPAEECAAAADSSVLADVDRPEELALLRASLPGAARS
ncbi:MAG TPA: NTP transferase domain-containing protein [Acidimicrobiales bacterium]|nr:NTP transferase domain-containing protein [Acidimicrobiales bacterium]